MKAGSVVLVLRSEVLVDAGQRMADELKLKGALAELRGFVRAVEKKQWDVTVNDREIRVDRAIYCPAYETALAVLPKVTDEKLISEAEKVLEEAKEAVEKAIG